MGMLRKILLPLAIFASLAISPAHALTAGEAAALKKAEAYLNGIKTLKARFLQVNPDGKSVEGDAYVHRVGRTARYNANGRALLFLLPTEEQAVSEALTKAGVPIKRLTINSNKTVSVASRAAALALNC
jgi:hypothetical protein